MGDDITINWLIVACFFAAGPIMIALGLLLKRLFPSVYRIDPRLFWANTAILLVSSCTAFAGFALQNEIIFFISLLFLLPAGSEMAWLFFAENIVISRRKLGPMGVITNPDNNPTQKNKGTPTLDQHIAPTHKPIGDRRERTASALRGIGRSLK